mmetsp:Transcript_39400/g.85911  ORF Transcript_39400/g.85911 Transcript_39400/m.85911 type:complete len:299 (-) Transcript_39400:50-946(-)
MATSIRSHPRVTLRPKAQQSTTLLGNLRLIAARRPTAAWVTIPSSTTPMHPSTNFPGVSRVHCRKNSTTHPRDLSPRLVNPLMYMSRGICLSQKSLAPTGSFPSVHLKPHDGDMLNGPHWPRVNVGPRHCCSVPSWHRSRHTGSCIQQAASAVAHWLARASRNSGLEAPRSGAVKSRRAVTPSEVVALLGNVYIRPYQDRRVPSGRCLRSRPWAGTVTGAPRNSRIASPISTITSSSPRTGRTSRPSRSNRKNPVEVRPDRGCKAVSFTAKAWAGVRIKTAPESVWAGMASLFGLFGA